MSQILKSVAVFGLALLVVSPAFAAQADGKKKDKSAGAVAKFFELPKEITLSADQQTKMDEVKKEFDAKVKEVVKKQEDILTPEQKQARADAAKAAKAAGKKGKEAQADIAAAIKLTDEQKKKQEEVGKEVKALKGEITAKVSTFLTDDQKAQLKPKKTKKNA